MLTKRGMMLKTCLGTVPKEAHVAFLDTLPRSFILWGMFLEVVSFSCKCRLQRSANKLKRLRREITLGLFCQSERVLSFWEMWRAPMVKWSGKGSAGKFVCTVIVNGNETDFANLRTDPYILQKYVISPIFSLQKRDMWSIAYCFVFGLGFEPMIPAFHFLSLRCRFQEVLVNYIISPYSCSTTKAVSSQSFVALFLNHGWNNGVDSHCVCI